LIGLAVQVKRPTQEGDIRLIRVWAIAAVTPFEKAVVHTQNFIHDKWTGYVWLRGVRGENADLRDQIERMKLEQTRLTEDANMARRLQTLLQFKEQYVENTVAAQVIGTSGNDQSRLLYIDKGSDDGLKPDMAVITPTGIVGKIVQVSSGSAQVLPINDQLSGVGAALKDSRLQGILKGAPNGTTTLQYIMADEPVKPGEVVITSGGDRIFPKGLDIGRVAAVEPGKDLFLNIRVTPSARLNRLEEVLVITKVEYKLPDATDLGPIRASDILSERLPGVPSAQPVDANGNPVPQPGATSPAAGAAGTGAPATTTGTTQNAGAPNTAAGTRTSVPAGTAATKPATASPTGGTASRPANQAGAGAGRGATLPQPAGQSAAGANPAAAATNATKPVRKPPVSTPPANTQPPAAKPPEVVPQ
ncbi:MAG TPA: rod shape-determining protein MreC, partial [Candidatus Acidoferrum sp.]|nr:rod shape-determining protein MreC [Candidatus Acidoferrum sp.]HVP52463.1 rod shape-determining protein MreC [Terriglobales bacterium]